MQLNRTTFKFYHLIKCCLIVIMHQSYIVQRTFFILPHTSTSITNEKAGVFQVLTNKFFAYTAYSPYFISPTKSKYLPNIIPHLSQHCLPGLKEGPQTVPSGLRIIIIIIIRFLINVQVQGHQCIRASVGPLPGNCPAASIAGLSCSFLEGQLSMTVFLRQFLQC